MAPPLFLFPRRTTSPLRPTDALATMSHGALRHIIPLPVAELLLYNAPRMDPAPHRRPYNHYGDSNGFQIEGIGCRCGIGLVDGGHGRGADQDRRLRSLHRRVRADGRLDARRRAPRGK